jgi:hypothetical protein
MLTMVIIGLRCRAFLEKFAVSQLVKKFPTLWTSTFHYHDYIQPNLGPALEMVMVVVVMIMVMMMMMIVVAATVGSTTCFVILNLLMPSP